MSRPRFLPAGDEVLLLRAALLPPDDAVVAWRNWLDQNDIDKTPQLALDLFPAIYRNVGTLLDDERSRGILHGTYRRAWLRNQVNMSRVAAVIERLNGAGIETIVLKGAALVNSVYEDAGTRWMNDVDVLVHVADASRAYAVLLGEGWRGDRDHRGEMDHVVQVLRSVDLLRADGAALDLHWHVLLECCDPGDDDAFWDASVGVEVAKLETRRLCNEDLLLHAIVHGSYWGTHRSITWAMDAQRILAHAGDDFDWDRLTEQTTNRRLTLPVREGLTFLHGEMHVTVPDHVLQTLRATPVSLTERIAFGAQSVQPGSLGKMYRDAADYALRVRRRPLKEKLLGFIWYEKAVLKVGAWWHVPFRLAFLAGRRGGRAVRARLSKA
jgi:hypothetical protein